MIVLLKCCFHEAKVKYISHFVRKLTDMVTLKKQQIIARYKKWS